MKSLVVCVNATFILCQVNMKFGAFIEWVTMLTLKTNKKQYI